jgi:DNA-binding beta-propeller fold protein YncE
MYRIDLRRALLRVLDIDRRKDLGMALGGVRRFVGVLSFVVGLALLALPGSAAAFGPSWEFGSYGTGAGQLRQPGNGAFGPNGSFYVADWKNNRIAVFSKPGAFLFAFGKQVNSGAGNPDVCTTASGCRAGSEETPADAATAGAMRNPLDIAFDQAGNVYVADEGNNRIDVFTAAGDFLYALGRKVELGGGEGDVCTTACQAGLAGGGAGALDSPTGVEVSNGRLYVADNDNNRVSVFDIPTKAFLFAFGKGVNGGVGDPDLCTTTCQAGQASDEAGAMDGPYMLAIDQAGLLQVTDPANHRVDAFEVNGDFSHAYGREVNPTGGSICSSECQAGEDSATAGGLKFPTAIVVAFGARLLVADAETNRINEFNLGGFFNRAYGEGVDTGATAFEICSSQTTCQAGIEGTIPGAIPAPRGVAESGEIFAVTQSETQEFARVLAIGDQPPASKLSPPAPPGSSPIVVRLIPINNFTFGRLRLNEVRGTAALLIGVPAPGTLVLKGRGIARETAVALRAGRVRLPIRLFGEARQKLLETGTVRVRAKVAFTPYGGTVRTKSKKLTLRKAF